MMDFARGYRAKKNKLMKMKELRGEEIGLNPDTLVIIKLPDSPVLRIMSRSLFLAMVILALPSIGSIIRDSSSDLYDSGIEPDLIGFAMLPLLVRDLADEGLLKKGHKGLIVGSTSIGDLAQDFKFLNDNDIDLVIESDLDSQNSIPNEMFDVVFTFSIRGAKSIDRVLKIGGIVVMELSNNPSNEFQQLPNYRIVYLRRFNSTVVAMRKIGLVDRKENSPTKRRLCGVTPEAKKAALTGLEDVWLEPPRRALTKLSNQSKKIKFLPDLLGDSLESYPRRILITDDKSSGLEWFHGNYPTRDQDFEIYNLETEVYDTAIGISDWLMNNVREDDYVVMKAEAEMVEEMVKEKTICLVDELFLECKNQWQDGGEENNKSKRAYWQCLALYGRLRDEGVAVHQWWV